MAGTAAHAQDGSDADALAKQLSNPVASLVSVPFQFNADYGYDGGGERYLLNIQPVIPMSIGPDWNLITRVIVPVVHQDDVFGPSGTQTGLGDITPTLFFSPKQPTAGGLVWGVGPVFLLPTATDDLLGADQWAAGPSAVMLKQTGSWTVGLLANHLWSLAGDDDRSDISTTFLQPFLTRSFPGGRTLTFNLESSYNWKTDDATVPLNITYSKVTQWGGQLVSVAGGGRVYVEAPDGGPEWGLRLQLTLLYPKQ
ncbi:transporter [Lysobacter sp. 13A]|uniref:Transporter n=1 Tax=Novilysobacter selenitireducens TaxID=2872639 RepID=A0ABS7T5G0_9GAMM|nr:transporter [Lysobacter selenitireducens]